MSQVAAAKGTGQKGSGAADTVPGSHKTVLREKNRKDCAVSLLFDMTLFENSNKNIGRYESALVPSVSAGS